MLLPKLRLIRELNKKNSQDLYGSPKKKKTLNFE